MTKDLIAIADEINGLLPMFVDGGSMSGLILPTEHSARFKALAIEARSMLGEELGHANEFSMNLIYAVNSGAGGFVSGPSYNSVSEVSEIINAGIRAIQRNRNRLPVSIPIAIYYVDLSRIAALQTVRNDNWDFKRLAELCREINVAANNSCYMSVAMLLRTILDHVPPVLGFTNFSEVANNYGGPKSQKSFKISMQNLERSLRNIADTHLHSPIKEHVDLPSEVQVNFKADLDVLIGELIRVSDAS